MITIIGPRDMKKPGTVDTTSHSSAAWSTGLSPFSLGPVTLYGSHTAPIFENAWQFAKLYPEHADANGQPTNQYWTWAQNGWNSTKPFRYPFGKRRKPLCSIWDGQRLDYIAARKQIYLALYQKAVKHTRAYQMLERLYQEQGQLTLFDFDGYDHRQLGMSFNDVIHCSTRICGHAFVLAVMLTYGSDFKIEDLPAVDHPIQTTGPKALRYPIRIVNRKTFNGRSQYMGRTMYGLAASPLGNPYKIKPHGPHTREDSVHHLYRKWIWKEMQDPKSLAYRELIRLANLAEKEELILSCWCAPELCHGTIIKNAIEFVIKSKTLEAR